MKKQIPTGALPMEPDESLSPDKTLENLHPQQEESFLAVNAIREPGRKHNYGAALYMWHQVSNGDFSDDSKYFLQSVARAIIELDEKGTPTAADIKKACGLHGRKHSRLEGAAVEFVRLTEMFDVLDDSDNPIPGPHPIPTAQQIEKAIENHPEAQTLRKGNRTKVAQKAYETMRKKP